MVIAPLIRKTRRRNRRSIAAFLQRWIELGRPGHPQRFPTPFADYGQTGHRLQHLIMVPAVGTTETNDTCTHDHLPMDPPGALRVSSLLIVYQVAVPICDHNLTLIPLCSCPVEKGAFLHGLPHSQTPARGGDEKECCSTAGLPHPPGDRSWPGVWNFGKNVAVA